MKKIILIASLTLAFALTACGSETVEETTTEVATTSTQTTEATTESNISTRDEFINTQLPIMFKQIKMLEIST